MKGFAVSAVACLCFALAGPVLAADAPTGSCDQAIVDVLSRQMTPSQPAPEPPGVQGQPQPTFVAIVSDICCTSGSQCPAISGYSKRCGGSQCDNGPGWYCLYSTL